MNATYKPDGPSTTNPAQIPPSGEETGEQHRGRKVCFNNEVMDLYFSRFMSYASWAGAQQGECLWAASQIEDGDLQTWVAAWQKVARRVEAQAMSTLENGHLLSAHDTYLRACTYYCAALALLHPFAPRYLDTWADMRSCFRMAAALSRPPIMNVEIPFEGKSLPGYFVRPPMDLDRFIEQDPLPTLIVVGGGEMYAEELYFWAAAAGVPRGYNTLLIELPGQGSTPLDGLFYCVNAEKPMRAVVDYALSLPDVDPDRLYAYGVSSGGYMVARAAAYDKRIKACVLNAPVTNIYRLLASQLPHDLLHHSNFDDRAGSEAGSLDPVTELLLDKLCWRAGTSSIVETLALAKWAHMGELVCRIECPTLCLVSEGESAEQSAQAREFYNDLNAPRQMRIFTADEGAEAHCQSNNLGLMHAAVFDWLDEL